ncbi:MAG: sigma-70 family RNA polymerase sigma factor [Planctomycetota bacterium]
MTFLTTRWSLVFRATSASESGRAALAELCQCYWPAVHAFYRRAVREPEEALDLTQGLFARILERNDFAAVTQERGRFRNWLCACARHHLADVRAAASTKKRGGAVSTLAIDAAAEDDRERLEPIDPQATPEEAFAQRFVAALIDRAIARVGDEWERRGRGRVFAMARACLDGEPAEPYAAIAERLGTSEGAFKVAVHRLRDRVREVLLDEVRQTVDDPAVTGDEVAFLLRLAGQRKVPRSR